MGTTSFFVSLLLSTFLLHLCLSHEVAATGISNRKATLAASGEISPRVLKFYPAIQEFKKRITSDPKGILKTWNRNDKNVCKYKGFFCAPFPTDNKTTVSGVDFNGFGFAGENGKLSLSGFIENLTDITIFHANSNNFTDIPWQISTIPYFFELDLSNNKLSGQFPTQVFGAKQLTFLDLRFNSLNGAVPPQVFLLDVEVIFINDNNFEQKLPDNLGSTSALYATYANNKFTGEIPPSIGRSKNLLEVLLLNNKLTGCLPFEIGYLQNATVFDASFNYLTGPIPQSFQCLFSIQVLSLAQNTFYGSVPDEICKHPNLQSLDLSNNYFTEVGPECRKLIAKKVVDARKNCIKDLPNQRTKAECAAFFSKPHKCANEKFLTHIPCNPAHRPAKIEPSATLVSYEALKPQK
jgi:hypothetical protein